MQRSEQLTTKKTPHLASCPSFEVSVTFKELALRDHLADVNSQIFRFTQRAMPEMQQFSLKPDDLCRSLILDDLDDVSSVSSLIPSEKSPKTDELMQQNLESLWSGASLEPLKVSAAKQGSLS